ncbi:MAG TPA: DUF2382 domain-containing protein [Candidatus Caenarcaniphilales bacterium]
MALRQHRRAVGVFPSRREAEHALNELRDSGFPMEKVSVVAKDSDPKDQLGGAHMSDHPGNKADEGAKAGVVAGGALGGLTGLLVGLGALAIPGIGPVMLAGAGATAIATALSGGAIGAAAGGLGGALIGSGIPEERAKVYSDRVSQGDYLVMVDGTDEELRRAESILSRRGIRHWGVYNAPGVDASASLAVDNSAPRNSVQTLKDFDPNYRETLGDDGIQGFGVYTEGTDNQIGTVSDVLVDRAQGHFRYLVVDIGPWISGKKVLLPVGRSRIDYPARRVYTSLSREQAEALPEFNNSSTVDYDYEEQVRRIYRPTNPQTSHVSTQVNDIDSHRETYSYQEDPSLYEINDANHQTLRLYEERLIATKKRLKIGEVTIGKHIETVTARTSVPLERERIVIERTTPVDAATVVSPDEVAFQAGEVTRMETYEERADIHKEAFVREEVIIRKEVDQDTVDAEETLRREALDINTAGHSVVDTTPERSPSDRS